jgi:hypothetical protein
MFGLAYFYRSNTYFILWKNNQQFFQFNLSKIIKNTDFLGRMHVDISFFFYLFFIRQEAMRVFYLIARCPQRSQDEKY